ncbi:enoyl-CoA-hydratase DpgB [Streptomyces sp. NPDC058691]|uniref:enoyl-CoA-hydratase DpgB n=1 Tax=Streptomyces sp. NPDC058691 TaxID=3346601 RepID=UPI0036571133
MTRSASLAVDLSIRVDGAQPLSPELVLALNALCDQAEDADARGPVVLEISGAPATVRDLPLPLVNKWERALRRLERLDMPVVAVMTGDCGGVALEALLATDYRIAEPTARLLPSVEAEAVWPGMALYRLVNQIGVAATRRTVLFGTPVPADQALAMHLLDQVTDDPADALFDVVETVMSSAHASPAIRRQLMLDATTTSFEEALGRHLAACDRVLRNTTEEASS